MKNYVGIDLGTTNSAISTFDGKETRIWKSPEQNDVTPSAIYIDRRGNKYVGKRAYDAAPQNPDNAVTLFKRVMGTSTALRLSKVGVTMNPEECSAEVLKTLFGYLPEEIRNDPETGTVITVPAAFNQMQRDATMEAARLADIGNVALMQEPVAAVMSVMRSKTNDGTFLVYDLGGGTLDIAIAESISKRVSLLSHGGISVCGGRAFDRGIYDNIVKPWLFDHFNFHSDFSVNDKYKVLTRMAIWAAEKAKIELSAREDALIILNENEIRIQDLDGNDIYLEIPITRDDYNKIIDNRIMDTIDAARESINQAGLTPADFENIVFIGGPTNYKPLRDKVSFELGIPGVIDVDPMTAVAVGASVFAESIDWNTVDRSRKTNRGQLQSTGKFKIMFNYTARTPDDQAIIIAKIEGELPDNCEFQVDSLDTGWTSGHLSLKDGAKLTISLQNKGENMFKVSVFDEAGGPICFENDVITVVKTAASIDAIPASYSVGVETLEKLNGVATLDWLVRAGEFLPKKGQRVYKAATAIKAGSTDKLFFKLWEGEIENPISDNRAIGVFCVSGKDFDEGIIRAGADLIMDYEVKDSGEIDIHISIPQICGEFLSNRNFYSRREGQIDFNADVEKIQADGEETLRRIEAMAERIDDPELDMARSKVESAISLDSSDDIEQRHAASENVHLAKKMMFDIRKNNLAEIREMELEQIKDLFDSELRDLARPTEVKSFDALVRTAENSINRVGNDFEEYIDELRGKLAGVLWRQDWFVIDRFKSMMDTPYMFVDQKAYSVLINQGKQYIQQDDIENLRMVILKLWNIQIEDSSDDNMSAITNIIRG